MIANSTVFGLGAIGKQAHDRSGEAICNLASQQCSGCRIGLGDSLEEEEQVVEPAGGHQVVDEMAHSVAEDLLLVQAVEAVLLVPDVEQVRVDVVVALGEHAVLD